MKMMRLEDEGEKRISKSFGPMGSHYWGHTGHEKWKETVGGRSLPLSRSSNIEQCSQIKKCRLHKPPFYFILCFPKIRNMFKVLTYNKILDSWNNV